MNRNSGLTGKRNPFQLYFPLFLSCLISALIPRIAISADSGIRYTVSIEGITDSEIKSLLENTLDTVILKEKHPASLSILERRVRQDIPRILMVLRSWGFYGARVDYKIDSGMSPVKVQFNLDPGHPFLLESVDIRMEGEAIPLKDTLLSQKKIGLSIGSPAKSRSIIDAQDFIKHWLRTKGFPFVSVEKPRVVVDHQRQAVSVVYSVNSGPKALFGETHIEGLKTVKKPFVRTGIPWKKGDVFNADLLLKARNNLNSMLLFSIVDIKEGEKLDDKRELPILIKVTERKHRTFKAGVSYQTDEGPGGNISWENRNILGSGERLNISGNISDIGYAMEGDFHKPAFLRRDQALILNLRLAQDNPEAYTSRNMVSLGKIERSLSKKTILSAGIGYRVSRIEQFGIEESYNFFSLPLSFDRDTRNDILDPSAGAHLNIQMAPYHNVFGPDLRFLKGYVSYSRYFHLSNNPNLTLASIATMGAMEGASLDSIPADLRFYAGGGGSIRGYSYQSVGPLMNGVPLGGKSLFSISTDIRARLSDRIGLVLFIDGGTVFQSALPDFNESLLWGAGVGFRYFTPIGPLRLDLGLPLQRRDGIDDPFQIYVSLGQAF